MKFLNCNILFFGTKIDEIILYIDLFLLKLYKINIIKMRCQQ